MNKKLLVKLIHLKVEEYKFFKECLPSFMKNEINRIETKTKSFVKEVTVEYLKQSIDENYDNNKNRNAKKIKIDS
jgi:hypothetical protein